ncbi:GFA family protein [uncultured Salinisphaera sp.]|uniref:GFA family protein n=1 Tax=uncultured Salinisphaera sp. TaxID=359372 RepID=UPI0032B16BA5|tara:strand:- start:479 stop:874 length:396 start_codon:yes stop_codon:yes gene_type:complete
MTGFNGRCACGAIVFTITGPVGDVVACHCRTCRRASGFVWAAVECADRDLSISGDTLAWWASSEQASRGFCAACGSSLFFKLHETGRTSVAPGVIDTPLTRTVARHIFCAEAGDYYRLADDVPQHAAGGAA